MWIVAAFALAGGLAQLVDGTLGMGFGVTSATALLFMGVAPVTASAATHAAKLPTTLISGLSHWRVGNVDTAVLLRVALPGAVGGFLGAVVLTNVSLASSRAWMSGLLIFFGLVIFARFGLGVRLIPTPQSGHTARWLSPIGLLGGFVDATGGGGWGPVVTPSLMPVTRHEPRKVVGTVNAAEFVVAVSVSLGFLTELVLVTCVCHRPLACGMPRAAASHPTDGSSRRVIHIRAGRTAAAPRSTGPPPCPLGHLRIGNIAHPPRLPRTGGLRHCHRHQENSSPPSQGTDQDGPGASPKVDREGFHWLSQEWMWRIRVRLLVCTCPIRPRMSSRAQMASTMCGPLLSITHSALWLAAASVISDLDGWPVLARFSNT